VDRREEYPTSPPCAGQERSERGGIDCENDLHGEGVTGRKVKGAGVPVANGGEVALVCELDGVGPPWAEKEKSHQQRLDSHR